MKFSWLHWGMSEVFLASLQTDWSFLGFTADKWSFLDFTAKWVMFSGQHCKMRDAFVASLQNDLSFLTVTAEKVKIDWYFLFALRTSGFYRSHIPFLSFPAVFLPRGDGGLRHSLQGPPGGHGGDGHGVHHHRERSQHGLELFGWGASYLCLIRYYLLHLLLVLFFIFWLSFCSRFLLKL